MKIQIQSPHFKASRALIDLVKERVITLKRIDNKIERAEVTLVLEHKGKTLSQSCHLLLRIKGNDMFTKINSDSFERAVLLSVNALKRRLRKRKTKNMVRAIKENKFKTA